MAILKKRPNKREQADKIASEIRSAGYQYVADPATGTYQLVNEAGETYKGALGGVEEGSNIFSKNRRLKRMVGEQLAHQYYTKPGLAPKPKAGGTGTVGGDVVVEGDEPKTTPPKKGDENTKKGTKTGTETTTEQTPVPGKVTHTIDLPELRFPELEEPLEIIDAEVPNYGITGTGKAATDFASRYGTRVSPTMSKWAQQYLQENPRSAISTTEGVEPWRYWLELKGRRVYDREKAIEADRAERRAKQMASAKQYGIEGAEELDEDTLRRLLAEKAQAAYIQGGGRYYKTGGILYK